MFKVGLDAVNKSAQFKLNNNVSAITLNFLGYQGEEERGSANKLNLSDLGNKVNVRMELIRKNQPNVTLVDLPMNELVKVVDTVYRGGVKNTIPVALNENLILSDDAYVLATLDWKGITLTKLDVSENRVLGNTSRPFSVKAVEIDEQKEVNTEFYNIAVFGDDIKSLETVKSDVGDDGVVVSQKQELTYDYMQMLSDEQNGVMFSTEPNQKIKFYGAGKVYLVQL